MNSYKLFLPCMNKGLKSSKKNNFIDGTDFVRFYREYIPKGDGALSTLIHLIAHLAYTEGYVCYNGYYNHVYAGEYMGGKGFFKYLKPCDGKYPLRQSLDLLINKGIIDIQKNELSKVYLIKLNRHYTTKIFTNFLSEDFLQQTEILMNKRAATAKKGFINVPRTIYRALPLNYVYTSTDALIYLFLTTFHKTEKSSTRKIKYSFLAKQWNWSKSKVCRFFKKYSDFFITKSFGGNLGTELSLSLNFLQILGVFSETDAQKCCVPVETEERLPAIPLNNIPKLIPLVANSFFKKTKTLFHIYRKIILLTKNAALVYGKNLIPNDYSGGLLFRRRVMRI